MVDNSHSRWIYHKSIDKDLPLGLQDQNVLKAVLSDYKISLARLEKNIELYFTRHVTFWYRVTAIIVIILAII
jgi:hypothetical protein